MDRTHRLSDSPRAAGPSKFIAGIDDSFRGQKGGAAAPFVQAMLARERRGLRVWVEPSVLCWECSWAGDFCTRLPPRDSRLGVSLQLGPRLCPLFLD